VEAAKAPCASAGASTGAFEWRGPTPGVVFAAWRGIVIGEPISKANSRQIVLMGRKGEKRPVSIKSRKGLAYVECAHAQLGGQRIEPLLAGRLRFTATLYYRTNLPDLDESLVLDVLQGFVYRNDRQVRERHVFHAIDPASPRVEILVEALDPQQGGLL